MYYVRSVSQIMHEPFALDYQIVGTRNVNKYTLSMFVGINKTVVKQNRTLNSYEFNTFDLHSSLLKEVITP